MPEDEREAPKMAMTEQTPLISKDTQQSDKRRWSLSHVNRVLLCGFLVSLSFGVTQVPLVYVFRLMTCDAYYETHSEPSPGSDRCSVPAIEAGTAYAVSLLGASTTFFGVANLFIIGAAIKKYGVKLTLAVQVFWPAVRLAVQNIGVEVGSGNGIIIVQCSQIITIVGGPVGYYLALNTLITDITPHKERTGTLGRLGGCTMFGSALGFLVGGLLSDAFGIIYPFRVTLALFLISCAYVIVFLPHIAPEKTLAAVKAPTGITRFFGPLKAITPRKWMLQDGRIRREYGALVLAIGVFFGVLATGYIPTLLQMYATDVFGFGTTENSYLVSMNSFLRGMFLTFAFPRIIATGRRIMEKRDRSKGRRKSRQKSGTPDPTSIPAARAMEGEEEPAPSPPEPSEKEETFDFDLRYTQFSLVVDGLLTGAAAFVHQGWQMYLIAVLLPFGAGTASAAKGTILQMCPASERTDALGAIALVEMMARLSTTLVFGLIFAAFATIGKTYLVFVCNAGVALVGFAILLLSRFPPDNSRRMDTREVHDEE